MINPDKLFKDNKGYLSVYNKILAEKFWLE